MKASEGKGRGKKKERQRAQKEWKGNVQGRGCDSEFRATAWTAAVLCGKQSYERNA